MIYLRNITHVPSLVNDYFVADRRSLVIHRRISGTGYVVELLFLRREKLRGLLGLVALSRGGRGGAAAAQHGAALVRQLRRSLARP
jgi:hypothetical protein